MTGRRQARLGDGIDERHGRGVRVVAWLHVERGDGAAGKRDLQRALGLRPRRVYPVQARVQGDGLVLRMDAHYSPYENQSRGALRSYLERTDAAPDVLQPMAFEQHLDRWSIWINPTQHDVNPYVAIDSLEKELEARFGIEHADVYVVQHHDRRDPERWHLHVVIPRLEGMPGGEPGDREKMRGAMDQIGAVMVRALVVERALDRALDPARQAPVATDAQLAVLRGRGSVAAGLNRREASMVIEAMTGIPSWAHDRGRDR